MANLVASAGYTLVSSSAGADLLVLGPLSQASPRPCSDKALVLIDASCDSVTNAALRFHNMPERVAGYGGTPSVAHRQLVEIAVGFQTETATWQRAALFFQSLGRDIEVVHDGPALIAPRLIACLVNEAAYALMEGVATVADIDTAMKLGLNYPHGPLEWADSIGLGTVLRILVGLQRETGEDRYRPCPHLSKLATANRTFYDSCHA
jgi:3-hydroxybutyryl-CoA dehydrogenase